jgi:hypothetical protein
VQRSSSLEGVVGLFHYHVAGFFVPERLMNGACIDHMKEVTPHVCHRSRCGVRGASACTEVTDPDSDHSMWRHLWHHSLSSCIEALAGISTAERRLQGVLALIHQAGSVARRCSCRCRRTTSGSKPSDVGGGNPPILVPIGLGSRCADTPSVVPSHADSHVLQPFAASIDPAQISGDEVGAYM